MKGFIYKYTFPDGKVYIGQTRRPIQMRHAEHISPSTGPMNPGFWKAYQKLGMPELTILETIEAEDLTVLIDQLNQWETAYILIENATDPAFGYNRKTTGTTYSPEINLLRKECNRLCELAEEEKQPFFASLIEKLENGNRESMTEDEKSFVEGYIENNNLFVHPAKDEKVLEENPFMEGAVLPSGKDDFFFYEALDYAIWLYFEETREIIENYVLENAAEIIRKARQGTIIQQLDLSGNVVREFESQDEIRSAFSITRLDNIINAIKGRQKTAYGFCWRYKPV